MMSERQNSRSLCFRHLLVPFPFVQRPLSPRGLLSRPPSSLLSLPASLLPYSPPPLSSQPSPSSLNLLPLFIPPQRFVFEYSVLADPSDVLSCLHPPP